MKSKWFKIGIILAGLAIYISGEYMRNHATNQFKVSSHASSTRGLSVIHKLTGKQITESFFSPETLDGIDTVFVTSPLRQISDFEKSHLQAFVNKGGRIYISFHDEFGFRMVESLIERLGLNLDITENENFKNGLTDKSIAPHSDELFNHGDIYEFYSLVRIGDDKCDSYPMFCFFRRAKYGQGEMIVQVGLPLFGNALMGMGDNMRYVANLLVWSGRIGFDEYHQGFRKRTAKDLLTLPIFIFPVLGLAITILLYFIFADSPLRNLENTSRSQKSTSLADINISVLKGTLRGKNWETDVVNKIKHWLSRRYPERSLSISSTNSLPELTNLHKTILLERGSKKP